MPLAARTPVTSHVSASTRTCSPISTRGVQSLVAFVPHEGEFSDDVAAAVVVSDEEDPLPDLLLPPAIAPRMARPTKPSASHLRIVLTCPPRASLLRIHTNDLGG